MFRLLILYLLNKLSRKSSGFRKVYRLYNIKNHRSKLPEYLKNNSFLKELNFKIWVTKGARFQASKRCRLLSIYSNKTICILTVYSIVLSVVFLPDTQLKSSLPEWIVSIFLVCFSIVILVYNQLESQNNYSTQAAKFHQCALDLSDLYNELRLLKNQNTQETVDLEQIKKISDKYEDVLKRYDNHEPIDYDIFKLSKRDYFELSLLQILMIHIRYFVHVRFWYYLFIWGPIFILLWVILHSATLPRMVMPT